MVALNTAYTPSKTLERSQNRVGDFFCEGAGCAGSNRLASRITTKEKSAYAYETASGRPFWPNRDPISESGSRRLNRTDQILFTFAEIKNPYLFLSNNPIFTVDIDGRSALSKVIDFVTLGTACIPGSTGVIEKEGDCAQTCNCGKKRKKLTGRLIASKRWRCRNGLKKWDPGVRIVDECPVKGKCEESLGQGWKNGQYKYNVIFHPF